MLCEVQVLHIYLLWLQGPPDDLYLKEYSQILMTFMINMIRNRKKEDQKHFKFQTWHAMWSSGLQFYLILTAGSSRWLAFERIFSNKQDRYYKEWEIGRSKSISNLKLTCFMTFKAPYIPSFDFRVLQNIWKNILHLSWNSW